MSRATIALLLIAALGLAGCGRPSGRDAAAQLSAARPAATDGLCAEHSVLEAVCTKCNPALVAVFQASGDWCAEHQFPESFCPICHPERGGRPAVDVSADPADTVRDGAVIRFKSVESAELAGIEVAEVEAAEGAMSASIAGSIVADATRVALVNARVAGVLAEVRVEVGSSVQAGDTLAVLRSSEAAALRSRVGSVEARARAARAEHDREKALRDANIGSDRDLVAARRALEEAEADLAGAKAEVAVLGQVGADGTYQLRAPREGVVLERSGSVGELVHPEEPLFKIVDARSVWLELDVPERQLHQVIVGAEVHLPQADAQHGASRAASARIDFVAPVLDPHTRTARARATLANDDGAFRLNSRVMVRVALSSGAGVSVPIAALHRIVPHDVVFVRNATDEFELRRVSVTSRDADHALVSAGLAGGEEVATTGSFLLKTEVQKASIGSGCCEVE